ncbi:hypothetical protein [Streptomyces sp. NPDC006879]|uniref:hypothetical protein n=1 Tax=Streptomyces sp. NPDC006879 TaxID=3364767 RepID=UPI00369EBEF6
MVAKIAARAAREALTEHSSLQTPPHATVTVHHDIARVRITLELDYPSDIGGQCAAVRRAVAHRIEELAGMAVPEVDIEVERLHEVHPLPTVRGRLR